MFCNSYKISVNSICFLFLLHEIMPPHHRCLELMMMPKICNETSLATSLCTLFIRIITGLNYRHSLPTFKYAKSLLVSCLFLHPILRAILQSIIFFFTEFTSSIDYISVKKLQKPKKYWQCHFL